MYVRSVLKYYRLALDNDFACQATQQINDMTW